MDGEENLLGIGETKTKDAKWNLFRFQDHLLMWINLSAGHFQERDYPSSFEALTNVYTDAYGFFDKKEKDALDKLFKKARDASNDYIKYNINYEVIKARVRNQIYAPPSKIYFALLSFRKKLMEYMASHQLLIPQVKKGEGGAGEQ